MRPCLLLMTLVMPVATWAQPTDPLPSPALDTPVGACRPGGILRLTGRHLGDRPGRVRLTGSDGRLTGRTLEWTDRSITFRLTDDISGVLDSVARVRVWTAAGLPTRVVDCPFIAAREVQQVKLSYYAVGDCAVVTDPTHDRSLASGRLAGCSHAAPDSRGLDRWAITGLTNGWSIREWHLEDLSQAGGRVLVKQPPVKGNSEADVHFDWAVEGAGTAAYRFVIDIEGPRGVPPK